MRSAGIAAPKMLPPERRAAVSLSLIYAIRMLGLFMLLPIMALYGEQLLGTTPLLIGLAIGVYGLTQALLQIPFGWLSDRFGRKPVITAGLLIFLAGSLVAAFSEHIYGVILGRALQGAGAIASVVMALAADLTRESQRSKIMAFIGMSIGAAFIVSMVLGPAFYGVIGGDGIFYIIAFLSIISIIILWYGVPQGKSSPTQNPVKMSFSAVKGLFLDSQLLRLNLGILCLHFVLTACFLVIPYYLRDQLALPHQQHWWVYLAVMFLALLLMVPALLVFERRGQVKRLFLLAVTLLAICQFGLSQWGVGMLQVGILLVLFFAAFNALEAILPSLVSKQAPIASKGTALGIYSSCQFLGAFLGGTVGGWVLQHFGIAGVLVLGSIITLIWLIIAAGMRSPRDINNYLLNLADVPAQSSQHLTRELAAIRGVMEAWVVEEEGLVYLRVDQAIFDEAALKKYAA